MSARNPARLICVRILLAVISLLMMAPAIFTIIIGTALLQFTYGQPTSGKSYSPGFDVSVYDLAVTLIVAGSILLTCGLAGLLGAITRIRFFLSVFFFFIILAIIATCAGGGYNIQSMKNSQSSWATMTTSSWQQSPPEDKALAQFVFTCCGFTQGDSLAYKGPPLFTATGDVNPCAPGTVTNGNMKPSDYPGCGTAGIAFWNSQITAAAWSLGLSLAFLLVSALISWLTYRYFDEADANAADIKRSQYASLNDTYASDQKVLLVKQ